MRWRRRGATDRRGGGGEADHVWALYAEHSGMLVSYLCALFRRPAEECEDIVHDTFVKLLRARCEGIEQPRLWLLRTARRLMLNRVRDAASAERLQAEYADVVAGGKRPLLIERHDHAESRWYRAQFRAALRAALPEMSPLERACVQGRAVGLSIVELAALHGVDERRVGEAILRGAAKVRGKWEGDRGAR